MATDRAPRVLAISVLVTALLYAIPFGRTIAWPLVLVSTLAHELGHGLAAALLGGSFESLRLHADASGVALWRGSFGRLATATVAGAGLVGPALAAFLLLVLGRTARHARVALSVPGRWSRSRRAPSDAQRLRHGVHSHPRSGVPSDRHTRATVLSDDTPAARRPTRSVRLFARRLSLHERRAHVGRADAIGRGRDVRRALSAGTGCGACCAEVCPSACSSWAARCSFASSPTPTDALNRRHS